MGSTTRSVRRVTVIVACMLLASSCGSNTAVGDDSGSGVTSPSATETTDTTTAPTTSTTTEAPTSAGTGRVAGTDDSDGNPSSSGSGTANRTFRVGDPFHSRCTVAWPSAPQRSTQGIEFRTTCAGIGHRYQFVDILSTDQALKLSPSHPTVDVEGTVADIVKSDMGFTVLAVIADKVSVQ